MAHFPKPFFRQTRNLWYVQVQGKQINLGSDREQAFQRYHELMQTPLESSVSVTSNGILVVQVLDVFLEWCQKNKAPRTYDWYRDYLQSFVRSLDQHLTIDKLKPFHVLRWLDSHPSWATSRRGAIISIQRALNWAARMGYIDTNPVRYMEKPPQGRREQIISFIEYQQMLDATSEESFRDLLTTCWEVGPRPQEICTVQAEYYDQNSNRWIFPTQQSKGKKSQRVVYLTDTATAICERLCARWPKGAIYRNSEGNPWTSDAIRCGFKRLRDKLGVKYSIYAFRHTWCTRALSSGNLDAVTVSVLMGHRDTQMISRHYAHLTQRTDHLRASVRKAISA